MKLLLSISRVNLTVGQKIAIKDRKDEWYVGKVMAINKRIVVRFNTGREMRYKLTDEKYLIPVRKGGRLTSYKDSEIERLKSSNPAPPPAPPPSSSAPQFVAGNGKWITQPTITNQGAAEFLKWFILKEPLPQFKLLARKITDIRVINLAPVVGNKFYLLISDDRNTLFWNNIPPSPSVNYPELSLNKLKTISKDSIPLLKRELGKMAWDTLKTKPDALLFKDALLQESAANKFVSRFQRFMHTKRVAGTLIEDDYVMHSFAECCRFYSDLHLVPQQGAIFRRLFLLLS